ncbi:MAG: hypothetical protein R3195_00145 [Gemmatimonadota bacterium]|nr:hypothetical protein [Gemmatimonadota bacterium]
MSTRIHIVLDPEEKERYRALASREGKNLSEWVREAVRERAADYPAELPLDTPDSLDAFFAECDRVHGPDAPPESDWEELKRLIAESKIEGLPRP